MRYLLVAASLLLFAATGAAADEKAGEPKGTSETKPASTPRFVADTSQAPELQPWGRAAEALCQVWYPRLVAILKSDDTFRPLDPVVHITFEDQEAPAAAGESEIHLSIKWVKSHPNDFGLVIHALTHLVQRYPDYDAAWVVEGIADYMRLQHFEPALPRPVIDFDTAKYTDSRMTSAMFLAWIEAKYSPDVVPRLNAALREQKYNDALFKEITGKELGKLWSEFAESERQKQVK